MQVPTLQQHEALAAVVAQFATELREVQQSLPEYVDDVEAQRLTGLSRATLYRERRRVDSLIQWKAEGGVRYLRSSLLRYNKRHLIQRQPAALTTPQPPRP